MIACHLSSICPFSIPLNNFSCEIPGPNFFKFYVNSSVKGGLKICTNSHGPLIKMVTVPIYVKYTLESSPEPRKLLGRILVYSSGDSRSIKFVQMMIECGPLTFLWQFQMLNNHFHKMYKE